MHIRNHREAKWSDTQVPIIKKSILTAERNRCYGMRVVEKIKEWICFVRAVSVDLIIGVEC